MRLQVYPPGRSIELAATCQVFLSTLTLYRCGDHGASIRATRDGPGAPGKIEINADTVTLEGRSTIGALNRFAGPGTPVTVNSRTVSLSGDSTSVITGIFSQSDFNPTFGVLGAPFRSDFTLADSGPITINAIDKLTVVGPFAQITSDSFALAPVQK